MVDWSQSLRTRLMESNQNETVKDGKERDRVVIFDTTLRDGEQ